MFVRFRTLRNFLNVIEKFTIFEFLKISEGPGSDESGSFPLRNFF